MNSDGVALCEFGSLLRMMPVLVKLLDGTFWKLNACAVTKNKMEIRIIILTYGFDYLFV